MSAVPQGRQNDCYLENIRQRARRRLCRTVIRQQARRAAPAGRGTRDRAIPAVPGANSSYRCRVESIEAVTSAAVIHTHATLTAALTECQIALIDRCLGELRANDRIDPWVVSLQAELDQLCASVAALRRRNGVLRDALHAVAAGQHTNTALTGAGVDR